MDSPYILLSTAQGAERNYVAAFSEYGFKCNAGYLVSDSGYDALVLCGGGDIDPSFYGEACCGSMPSDFSRDKAEFSLFEKYYSAGKPIFGICRGCQFINVAFGGSLIQHIETASAHTGLPTGDSVHDVNNRQNSVLYELYGDRMTVNSSHHQACARLGKELEVIQCHDDGTVEAICGNNILAFQWHPERMTAAFRHVKYTDPSKIFKLIKKMIIKK